MMGKKFLVIGSVNLDVMAEFHPEDKNIIDKVGKVKYSIGGTAYNIAHNIAKHGFKVSLVSFLKEDSFITHYVLEKLKRNKISIDFIEIDKEINESSFVSLNCNGELISAVSSTSINHGRLNYAKISEGIKSSSMVIMDCNMDPHQINKILEISKTFHVPTTISGVSEEKVIKIKNLEIRDSFPLAIISMNKKEFEALGMPLDCQICQKLKASYLIITDGVNGFEIYSINKESPKIFPAVNVKNFKSSSGAGDALLASVCIKFVEGGDLIINEKVIQSINQDLEQILALEYPTDDAELKDFKVIESKQKTQEKGKFVEFVKTISEVVTAIGTIWIVILTLLVVLIGYFALDHDASERFKSFLKSSIANTGR